MLACDKVNQKRLWSSLLILAISLCCKTGVAAELVMVESSGCSWCELWEEEVGVVYNRTPQGTRVPIRRLNFRKKKSLKTQLPVTYTPTFILLNDQKEVGRITGYPGESHFWALLDELLKKLPNPPTYGCPNVQDKTAQTDGTLGKHLC